MLDFQRMLAQSPPQDSAALFLKTGQAHLPRHDEIVYAEFHIDNAGEIRVDGETGYVPEDWLHFAMPPSWPSTELQVVYNDLEIIINSPFSNQSATVEINMTRILMRGYKVNVQSLRGGRTVIPLCSFVDSGGIRFDHQKYVLNNIMIRTKDRSAKDPTLFSWFV